MSSGRAEVMATHGFTFYTDLSNRIVDHADSAPVERVDEVPAGHSFNMHYSQVIRDADNQGHFDLLESRLGLQVVINGLVHACIPRANTIEGDYDCFGIKPDDLQRFEKITAGHGLLDLGVSWRFAGALASQSADVLIDEGVVERDEVAAMTLEDWGNIIKTPWFKILSQRAAMTRLGTYGVVLGYPELYKRHALLSRILEPGGKEDSLESAEGYLNSRIWEGEDGYDHVGVAATPRLISILSQKIKDQNKPSDKDYSSSGCPVARHSTRLPASMLEEDPHTVELIKQGTLQVSKPFGETEPDTVLVSQLESAIDKQLASIGRKLIEYHQEFGSPTYSSWPLDRLDLDYARRKRDRSGVIDKLSILSTSV